MALAPGKGVAPNPAPLTVCRIRVRFAKRGRLRFASHRDVARAFERAVRRAGVPVAHSHGFNPHPRLSWVGAAPTGTASEAEYLEVGLTEPMAPDRLAATLDAALPLGLDVLAAVAVEPDTPPLAELIDATRWRLHLPGVKPAVLADAVRALLATGSLIVRRPTKSGTRPVDVRAALTSLIVDRSAEDSTAYPGDHAFVRVTDADRSPCAILVMVVRQTTPAVRPDDVLGALQIVADLCPPIPPVAVRLAQGLLEDDGHLADPFDSARVTTSTRPGGTGAHQAPAPGGQHGAEC